MVAPRTAPAAEVNIDAALVSALVQTQMPEASHFALGDRYEGWDCVTWRLGDDWAVRLPRTQSAADLQITELAWLPRISANWPFRAPIPVRIGQPSQAYPWRWSIVNWIHGVPAFEGPLNDHGAHELGIALRALHTPAPPEAPHNPWRSQTLLHRSARTAKRLDTLTAVAANIGWTLDSTAIQQMYDRGAATSRPPLTWAHLDLHGGNVISHNGLLAGIVDWADAAAGDPATDIGQAMVLLPQMRWDAFIHGYGGLDPVTFTRARAEALSYSLVLATIPEAPYAPAGWAGLEALGVARRTH